MKTFELQPLRIPAGWFVSYNTFSEYDPGTDSEEYCFELCEDMMQLKNKNLLIDLGWYPEGDIKGNYKLSLVDAAKELPFETPLQVFSSGSKKEIIQMLENWTSYEFFSKYLR